jgi:hypothetical protein
VANDLKKLAAIRIGRARIFCSQILFDQRRASSDAGPLADERPARMTLPCKKFVIFLPPSCASMKQ